MMRRLIVAAALAPPIVISLLALTKVNLSNYYVAVGIVSLLLISSTDKVKWMGVGLVYIPAIYTVGLLLTGVVKPFLGLASGYILAAPLVLAIATYSSGTAAGMVSGYFSSYTTALLIYGVVAAGNVTPETIFVNLVRNIVGFFSRDQINLVPQETPPYMLLASLTALATLALMLGMLTRKKLVVTPVFLKAVVSSVAAVALGTVTVYMFPAVTSLLLLALAAGLTVLSALMLRDRDD
ncbi:MAG: hypothetical protein QW614_02225 [Candidatus Caldarchaeum sp.]|uniref:Uncharacterized protein n=1 Tax=Caldiarchaeum subterraneum TaxID=311458 RepID=A0A7C5L7L5_CALS0